MTPLVVVSSWCSLSSTSFIFSLLIVASFCFITWFRCFTFSALCYFALNSFSFIKYFCISLRVHYFMWLRYSGPHADAVYTVYLTQRTFLYNSAKWHPFQIQVIFLGAVMMPTHLPWNQSRLACLTLDSNIQFTLNGAYTWSVYLITLHVNFFYLFY